MPSQLSRVVHHVFYSVLFILFTNSSYAQNLLNLTNDTEIKEISVPLLAELNIHWWNYFESSESTDELNARIEKFTQELSESVKLIEDKNISENKSTTIVELLKQFQKQKFLVLEHEKNDEVELQDSYSIQELMDINTEKNKLVTLLNNNQDEIIALKDGIATTVKQIDRLKVSYFDTKDASKKLEIGLNWIDTRLKQALDEVRVERIVFKNHDLNTKINAKDQQISQASQKIVLNEANKETDDTANLIEKQNSNQLNIDKLNLQLAQDFTDSTESRLNNELIRLDLALALIEDSKYSLKLNKKKQILLLENAISESTDFKILKSHITESKALLKKTNDQLFDGKKIAQDILLSSILNPKEYTKKELKLDEKKRKKAQYILSEQELINTLLDDNTFNVDLLEKRLNEIDKGYAKIWNNIKEFIIYSKDSLVSAIYTPLFTINEYPVTLWPLIKLILIILLGYLASKILSYFIKKYEKKHHLDTAHNRSSSYLIHAIVRYIIIFITILTSFSALGINLGSITLIAGALSVGIGFGLQNLVSNFVSGLTIMFDKTLSVGDYIQLEDGVTGIVKQIRARSTRINTNDNIDIIIPNSDMVTNKVINWTLKESIRRIKIPFGVAYGTDKELVKKAALEAASNVEFTLTHMTGKEPDIWLTEFADSSVNYTLLVWVANYGLRRPSRMKSNYLWELDNALTKYGIEVPFPQQDVNLNIVDKEKVMNLNLID